jgi:hypothetical protein
MIMPNVLTNLQDLELERTINNMSKTMEKVVIVFVIIIGDFVGLGGLTSFLSESRMEIENEVT